MSDQTTNDEQAGYTTKPKREPMLSDDEMFMHRLHYRPDPLQDYMSVPNAYEVRDFYESKITSGELHIVKTARFQRLHPCAGPTCVECDQRFDPDYNFCPGCGAKIVEA